MTHREKAKYLIELFNKTEGNEYDYYETGEGDRIDCWRMSLSLAKECAKAFVDEILKSIKLKDDDERLGFELGGNQYYWIEVKKQIDRL